VNVGSLPSQEHAMTQTDPERELAKNELAEQLMFKVEKHGNRYSLCRDVDLPAPTRHDDLTLEEAEDLLQTRKLRGFHGG
jgi:hypothetical protein